MADALLRRNLRSRPASICAFCWRFTRQSQRRSIGEKYLAKLANSELEWKEIAAVIRDGKKPTMLSTLEERGYVKDITGPREGLEGLMTRKRIGAYVGIDPTAPSMHVGNIVPLMPLFWMYMHGYRAHIVLGAATARIGDPSGRGSTRDQQHSAERKANIASVHMQMKRLWTHVEALAAKYGYEKEWAWRRALNNNSMWLNKLGVTEFMNMMGSQFRLGSLLSRDSVKLRMENGNGMSLSEFCYPLIQAWDWWRLYESNGIQLQIGGSDQYGNILTGIEGVNNIRKNHPDPEQVKELMKDDMEPWGFTVPLLTTAAGEKFGKSAGNAIWVDKEMLGSFELYQNFVRTADTDVERLLKLFTFMPLGKISEIMERHNVEPHKREAQHLLAQEFVALVHGQADAEKAAEQHRIVFSGKSTISVADVKAVVAQESSEKPGKIDFSPSLNKYAPQTNSQNAPPLKCVLPRSLVVGQPFARILYSAGLVSSKSEGHRLTVKQGAYVASRPSQIGGMRDELTWTPVKTFDPNLTQQYMIDDKILMLRVGKWNMRICEVISDDDFRGQGLSCPGWKEHVAALDETEVKESSEWATVAASAT